MERNRLVARNHPRPRGDSASVVVAFERIGPPDDVTTVEHNDFVPELGKGVEDERIADYSRSTDRLILTYDDDFVLEFAEKAYRGVLYSLPPCRRQGPFPSP